MLWKQLFARKTLETLHAEAAGENRLRRILGPVSLTSLGIGAIIGSGIFVMTGRVAAVDAGPAIVLSFVVAGVGCVFAAFCYAEFSAMAPVAGSAYTYAYATLGEMFAWIIGWDLVLEYAMACAVVAAGWAHYLNEFLKVLFDTQLPVAIASDPFTKMGAWFNLPAVFIVLACTVILVIGIRESATTNAILVAVKVGVVIFVIVVGCFYIQPKNWTGINPAERLLPEELLIPNLAKKEVLEGGKLTPEQAAKRIDTLTQSILNMKKEHPDLTDQQVEERSRRLIREFYMETAKLPEKVAEHRIQFLTCQALAVYKVGRKRAETKDLRAEGRLSETAEKEALRQTLIDSVVKYTLQLVSAHQLAKEEEEAAVKNAAGILVQVVSSFAAQFRQEKLLSPAEARATVEVAVGEFTARLRRQDKLSDAEADRILASAKQAAQKALPPPPAERAIVKTLLKEVHKEAPKKETAKWGMLGMLGLNKWLGAIDDSVRSPFAPYGLSGIIFGASLVFFAYIGFDAISTHSEEAKNPQRDVPIGILASLVICTVLYILVSAVITGMEKYQDISHDSAVAAVFRNKAEETRNPVLNAAALLIATGALAGLTSVLLITFLSQARIFLAMARDGLLPPAVFGAIHERFRTPHISTMLTGGIIAVVAAFTPIADLEEMVNIGTLMAFVIVCAAVLILRIKQPNAHRPFRTPFLYVMAPLGILVNLLLMLFLPPITWLRLVVWLALGLLIYFTYGVRHSTVGREMALGLPSGSLAVGTPSPDAKEKEVLGDRPPDSPAPH